MFSVVIPAYNAEQCIERCVNSVLNQTFGEFEIIVVNDGSTDGTLERLAKFSDKRLKVVSQENAQNPYICFLDSDDEWLENHLAAMHDLSLIHI